MNEEKLKDGRPATDVNGVLAALRRARRRAEHLDQAYVCRHYVAVGVDELDQDKPAPLLRLQYHDSIDDAVDDLGRPDEIGKVFSGFQKCLYEQAAA